MKQLSIWAFNHKWFARLLIVVLYFLLNVCGLVIGDLLFQFNVSITDVFVYTTAIICLGAFIFYPPATLGRKNYYAIRKTFDTILITGTLFFVIAAGNGNTSFYFGSTTNSVVHASTTVTNTEKPGKKLSKKSLLKKLKDNIRQLRKLYNEGSKTEKTILIFLTILVALVALFGIAALSCNLSCSGSEALALIVGIGGTALIIFLMARVIHSINRKHKKKKESDPAAQ